MINTVNNAEFWLLIGFLLFVFFTYKKLRNVFMQNISLYVSNLAEEMQQAQNLLDNSITNLAAVEKKMITLVEYEEQMFQNIDTFLEQLKNNKLQSFNASYEYKKLDLEQNIKALKLKLDSDIKNKIIIALEANIKQYLNQNPISDIQFALNMLNITPEHNVL